MIIKNLISGLLVVSLLGGCSQNDSVKTCIVGTFVRPVQDYFEYTGTFIFKKDGTGEYIQPPQPRLNTEIKATFTYNVLQDSVFITGTSMAIQNVGEAVFSHDKSNATQVMFGRASTYPPVGLKLICGTDELTFSLYQSDYHKQNNLPIKMTVKRQ